MSVCWDERRVRRTFVPSRAGALRMRRARYARVAAVLGLPVGPYLEKVSLVLSRMWNDPQMHGRVMVPFLDSLNHDETAATVSFFEYAQGSGMHAEHTYSAGDEVFVSYGQHSNAQLLQDYGFVLEEGVKNPHDTCKSCKLFVRAFRDKMRTQGVCTSLTDKLCALMAAERKALRDQEAQEDF